ncbi:MAG: glycosyltransferase family A protein, partial [Flavobacteriales bacterium]|nr:glycosyltransferase family A protein [Flavobacteriales bacterium]
MDSIRVSIIIPCYNHGEFLKEAIDSTGIDANEFCEVIIVNDGSTDELTLKIFDGISGERIRVIHQENKGVSAARNQGMNVAKGDFILLLDADNTIDPDYYNKAIQVFDSQPEISIIYSNYFKFVVGLDE